MKAIVLSQPGQVVVTDRPEPTLVDPADVIVRVTLAGLCGSDLHIVDGRDRGCALGTTMGHELVGVVVQTGTAVERFHTGDRVVAPFSVNCGRCFYCRRGLFARCASSIGFGFVDGGGIGLQGAQAERVRVPFADATLVKVPDRHDDGTDLHDTDVLFLGDILSTAYGCVEAAHVTPGDTVAVVGCGPVGLLCAHLAAGIFAAGQVIAVDSVPERREKACTLGANIATCDPTEAAALVRSVTDGRGADAVAEAVGSSSALSLALDLLRPGGNLSVAGYHTADTFPLPIQQAYAKNLTFAIGRGNARKHMDTLLPLVLAKKLRHRDIISHELPLSAGVEAYAAFANRTGGTIKVVLKP